MNHFYFKTIFETLPIDEKYWILDYLSSGKGVSWYEKIKNCKSLQISSKSDDKFFGKIVFYSKLKNKMINDKEYENAKKLYRLLKMKNLGNMNESYNFQDTIIICEIFESRASLMKKIWF